MYASKHGAIGAICRRAGLFGDCKIFLEILKTIGWMASFAGLFSLGRALL